MITFLGGLIMFLAGLCFGVSLGLIIYYLIPSDKDL